MHKEKITQQEMELLVEYPSEIEQRDMNRYDYLGDNAAILLLMKDRTIDLFNKRYRAAREVIDMIAERIGIDPQNTSFWLYAPDFDDSSPIIAKIDEYFSRSGDKVKLKKRIDELESENAVLRSLLVR